MQVCQRDTTCTCVIWTEWVIVAARTHCVMAALYRPDSGSYMSWTYPSEQHCKQRHSSCSSTDQTPSVLGYWPLRTACRVYDFPQTTSLSKASPSYNSGLLYTRRLSSWPGDTLAVFSCSSVAQGKLEICLYLPRTLQIFRSISEIAAGTLKEKDHTKPFSRALLLLSFVLVTKNPFLSDSRVESPLEDV